MTRFLKIGFCLLIIAGLARISAPIAFSQEEEIVPIETTGEVVLVDLENSTMTIKYLKDEENQVYEDLTIYIDNSTMIEKNSETISLPEINIGDEAVIEYNADNEGRNIATYIWLE